MRVLLVQSNGDSFDLQVFSHSVRAELPALAGLLEPAERSLGEGVVVAVNPNAAGLHSLTELQRLVDILSEDAGSQAVIRGLICVQLHFS